MYYPLPQVASTYLEACKACNRSATALELYTALQHYGVECTPAGHAVGLWTYLAPGNRKTHTLEAALRLLTEQGELLASALPGLAESTCKASVAAMGRRPRNSRPEDYALLAAPAQLEAVRAAREEQLYALLDLPARLVLASLSLAAKCEGGAAAAAALLPAVMQGLKNGSGSQALAFLELLPSWVDGLLPLQSDWNMALGCVLQDGLMASEQEGQEHVARAVAAVCHRLRAADPSAADPFWALELTAPALVRGGWTCMLHDPQCCLRPVEMKMVDVARQQLCGGIPSPPLLPQAAVLLAGDVLRDNSLALKAVEALEFQVLVLPPKVSRASCFISACCVAWDHGCACACLG